MLTANGNGNGDRGGIRLRRTALGLSQEALARRAGCSTSMVKLLESGYQPSASDVLPRIVSILNDNGSAANAPVVKEGDTTAHAAFSG